MGAAMQRCVSISFEETPLAITDAELRHCDPCNGIMPHEKDEQCWYCAVRPMCLVMVANDTSKKSDEQQRFYTKEEINKILRPQLRKIDALARQQLECCELTPVKLRVEMSEDGATTLDVEICSPWWQILARPMADRFISYLEAHDFMEPVTLPDLPPNRSVFVDAHGRFRVIEVGYTKRHNIFLFRTTQFITKCEILALVEAYKASFGDHLPETLMDEEEANVFV